LQKGNSQREKGTGKRIWPKEESAKVKQGKDWWLRKRESKKPARKWREGFGYEGSKGKV